MSRSANSGKRTFDSQCSKLIADEKLKCDLETRPKVNDRKKLEIAHSITNLQIYTAIFFQNVSYSATYENEHK